MPNAEEYCTFFTCFSKRSPQLHTHPDAVQHVSVGVDPDVEVGLDDVVELAVLLVAEEGVRHPDLGAVRHGEVLDLPVQVVVLQPVVVPSAANRLIGEVVQSRRRPLLGPSPG